MSLISFLRTRSSSVRAASMSEEVSVLDILGTESKFVSYG